MTSPRQRVLAVLQQEKRALKPYDILRLLSHDSAQVHPPTVYRALDFLVATGQAHRVDSSGSYVVCGHGSHHAASILLVCEDCGDVQEHEGSELARVVAEATHQHNFKANLSVVEVRGQCSACDKTQLTA